MKHTAVRTPDEGELWTSGGHNGWYAVINGKFVRVGITELEEADDAQRLIRALKEFYNPPRYRRFAPPKIDALTYHGNNFTFRCEDYKAYVEGLVTDRLNLWSDQIREAAKALAAVMVR